MDNLDDVKKELKEYKNTSIKMVNLLVHILFLLILVILSTTFFVLKKVFTNEIDVFIFFALLALTFFAIMIWIILFWYMTEEKKLVERFEVLEAINNTDDDVLKKELYYKFFKVK